MGSHSVPAAAVGSADLPNLLATLEAQGGVAPAQTAAYRQVFDALPSHEWRLAHLASLRRFLDSGNWQGAAAWMARC